MAMVLCGKLIGGNAENLQTMNEYKEIEDILNVVKSKLDIHNQFKKEYDKQLAFDFSLFNFFSIDENKVSKILAYFLDEKQNHGQGNLFLNEFVKTFYNEEIDTEGSRITCEKTIEENRRIDIYIELNGLTIAIENKIWADDQHNQIKDYADFLEKQSNRNYLLLYLNPYGYEPTDKSIKLKTKERLVTGGKFKVISYQNDIINLINNWLIICEADNVSYFLKEFKKYLQIKFLGKNTLNMSKDLRIIIENNKTAVQVLVKEYRNIENEIVNKLNSVGKKLDEQLHKIREMYPNIQVSKGGNKELYQYLLSVNKTTILIQFYKFNISLISLYQLQEPNPEFSEILKNSELNTGKHLDYEQRDSDLVEIFLGQVQIVIESFKRYDEFVANKG